MLGNRWTQFFIRSLLVPPNKFRPPQKGLTGDGVFEHVQNMFYTKALNMNAALVSAGVGGASDSKKDADDDGKLAGRMVVRVCCPLNGEGLKGSVEPCLSGAMS